MKPRLNYTPAPLCNLEYNIYCEHIYIYVCIYISVYRVAIPPRIFEMLQSHKDICRRYVRTCKEINIAFLAYEAQVYFPLSLSIYLSLFEKLI